jgi:hypothetical protein
MALVLIVEEHRRLSQGERAAQHGMRNLTTIFAPFGSRRCTDEWLYRFIDTSAAECVNLNALYFVANLTRWLRPVR